MKTLTTGIVVLVVGLVAMFIFEHGVEKAEKAECLKWQDYAHQFESFYLTQAEKQQCDRYQVEIDAPVESLPRM